MKTIKGNSVGIMVSGMFLILALAGCATSTPSVKAGGQGGGSVSELDLVTMPVPVNLESQPGVDGMVVKIYAVDNQHPKTQPIRSGTLEVLMFDGINRESLDDTNHCRHVWSFPSNELPAYSFQSTVGTGYFFALGWGVDRPVNDQITLIARYHPPQGRTVYSAPSYIAIPPHSAGKK